MEHQQSVEELLRSALKVGHWLVSVILTRHLLPLKLTELRSAEVCWLAVAQLLELVQVVELVQVAGEQLVVLQSSCCWPRQVGDYTQN